MKEKKVLICFVNYNQGKFLRTALKSLKTTNHTNYSVLFVNNSIEDDLSFAKNYPNSRFLKSKGNLGCPGGMNYAISGGKPDYYVLMDCDVEIIDPDWLKKYVDALDNDPKGVMVGGTMLFSHKKNEHAEKKILAENKKPFKVKWISGSLMMIKRSMLKELGMADESFFLYWEETDWEYRALMKGMNIWRANVPYYHYAGSSTNIRGKITETDVKKVSFYWYYRNEVRFALLNYSCLFLIKRFMFIFLRTLYHSTIKGSIIKIKCMRQAWKDISKEWPLLMEKRKKRQKERIVSDFQIARIK